MDHIDHFEKVDNRLNALETVSLKQLVNLNSLEKPDIEDKILGEEACADFTKAKELGNTKADDMIKMYCKDLAPK